MKKWILFTMIACLVGLGGQSFAQLDTCAIDDVPAATLLLPYFEVDLDDPEGVTTLFSINNASAAPALAHVIFWTNWSAPTIDFDVFLTGYDVVTVNLRSVFNGNIPITADEQSDPGDTISPHAGTFADNPQWDGSFPVCQNFFPFFSNPVIGGTALDRLVNGHTGQPVNSLAGACLGADLGDNVARGYVTIDSASECSLVLDPSNPEYFVDGGIGVANNNNVLWGDWFLIDPTNNFAQGDTLVHIEADASLNANTPPTGYTFYGRYTFPTGGDNREPLGTTWGVRYLNGGVFDGGTDLLVWRDSTDPDVGPAGWVCGNTFGTGPAWFPLNELEVVAFNEEEDAVELCFFEGGVISPPDEEDPACFPYETGRYDFGAEPLDTPFDFGWTFLNLNLPAGHPGIAFGSGGELAQSYVTAVHSALGLYSVGLPAIELTDACEDVNPSIVDVSNIPPF